MSPTSSEAALTVAMLFVADKVFVCIARAILPQQPGRFEVTTSRMGARLWSVRWLVLAMFVFAHSKDADDGR